jgi:DNA-binding NarL/FixJ family response regulator
MARTALLWCAEEQTVQVLRAILHELNITVEVCHEREAAETRLSEQRFDAVIVDFDGQAEVATAVLRRARQTSLNHNTLAITIVSGSAYVREIFALGSNFVLYKPVSEERAKTSLKAARSLMGRERRRAVRLPVNSRATLDYSSTENAQATLVDLSEEGTAIQSENRLPPSCKVYFKFNLPNQQSAVRLAAEVIWQDSAGRVGMRFVDVPQGSRRLLRDWLGNAFAQAKTVITSATTKSTNAPPALAATVRPSPPPIPGKSDSGLARFRAEPGNRRSDSRKPCQLGAEVFKAGTTIPNRCSLSDISVGGCYVEMPTPFPAGVQVEIQIRTRSAKARVAGEVQSTHPGFGMGVRFQPLSAEQQGQVLEVLRELSQSAQGLEMGSLPWRD